MKRIITIIIALGLIVPAVAVASRVATGSTRIAIERAAMGSGYTRFPQRCLAAEVTTKGGGNWATVAFNAVNYRSCERWAFDGVGIVHRALGRWHLVDGGSAQFPCGRLGIPIAVRRDLHLPCR
jgi:hypothetical protein